MPGGRGRVSLSQKTPSSGRVQTIWLPVRCGPTGRGRVEGPVFWVLQRHYLSMAPKAALISIHDNDRSHDERAFCGDRPAEKACKECFSVFELIVLDLPHWRSDNLRVTAPESTLATRWWTTVEHLEARWWNNLSGSWLRLKTEIKSCAVVLFCCQNIRRRRRTRHCCSTQLKEGGGGRKGREEDEIENWNEEDEKDKEDMEEEERDEKKRRRRRLFVRVNAALNTHTFRAEVERNQNCFCRLVIWQLAEQLNSHGRPAEPPSPRRLQVLAGVLAVKGRRDRSASHEQRSLGRKLWETSTSGPLRWGREGRDTSVQQIGLHSLKPKHTHQRRRAHTHVISLHLKHAHTHTHTHTLTERERWDRRGDLTLRGVGLHLELGYYHIQML